MLDPSGWSATGFCIFWLVMSFAGPRIIGLRSLFQGRLNPWNWLENMCLVLAVCSLAQGASNPLLAWMRDNLALQIPGVLWDIGVAIVNGIKSLFS